jgi:hypothetical protein
MWELLVNGTILEVGDVLRHRIIIDENQEIIQLYDVIAVEKSVFSARMIKNNDIDIPLESQISWFKEIAKLSESRLQIWITEKTKE